ncbi:MAG TPA: hypothetical protein VMV71_01135 [Candidatus Paceibacterota bacterium]|nr:hypothetical protein [Candidatus Paceibacterota bacterium]
MQLLISKALAAGFAASMVIGGSTPQIPNATVFPATTYQQNKTVVAFKDESPLNYWIDKLVYLESEGRNNLKVLDLNGLYSYGCLQFQMGTFVEYGMKYGLLSKGDDFGKLIYDCDLQKSIAKRIILENSGNWRKWYTSVIVRGLGLPPKETKPVMISMNSN